MVLRAGGRLRRGLRDVLPLRWAGVDMIDRAVELREAGLSIREIANLMDVPRSTVADWVKGIVPLEYVELDGPTPEEQRLMKLVKRCTKCGEDKTWLDFHARVKWPDGTMRRPNSWCKECVNAYWRERRADDPEWARELNRRNWQRVKNDPELLAKARERVRENSRVYYLRRRRGEEAA